MKMKKNKKQKTKNKKQKTKKNTVFPVSVLLYVFEKLCDIIVIRPKLIGVRKKIINVLQLNRSEFVRID